MNYQQQNDSTNQNGWPKILNYFCSFLLYAIIIAYLGLFDKLFLVAGLLFFGFLSGFFRFVKQFIRSDSLFSQLNLINAFLLLVSLFWLGSLLSFSPFPALSGRDEGSYANAAIYLAKEGNLFFKLPAFDLLKNEGPAHQALNFPGFVVENGFLTSQFSPAYSVWLAVFFNFFGSVSSFAWANAFLILGGATSFYFFLRIWFPTWVSAGGFVALLSHFIFFWFPRFTLSENLTFFLFTNLILFLALIGKKRSSKIYFWVVIEIAILFPLVRPEGWWVLFFLLTYGFLRKMRQNNRLSLTERIKKIRENSFSAPSVLKRKSFWQILFWLGASIFILIYTFKLQLPVYLRLFKDWINWSENKSFYQGIKSNVSLDSLTGLKKAGLSFLPSLSHLEYFWKIEWIYGVLIFGIFAFILFFLSFFGSSLLKKRERSFIIFLFLVSLPFWLAFFSPQISPDHPWFLRRFFSVILPSSLFLTILLAVRLGQKMIKRKESYSLFLSIFLGLIIVPSLFANAYFFNLKLEDGRSQALEQIGNYFQKDDLIFLSRESSGNGWKMFSEPLSSIYGLESAYVYSPENILNNREIINQYLRMGRRVFIVLGDNSFKFEHDLGRDFNLILDKKIFFQEQDLDLSENEKLISFPLIQKKEHTVKIYLLSPK